MMERRAIKLMVECYGRAILREVSEQAPCQLVLVTSNEAESTILAEFDRLTAELDRLRWHYPERGELPDSSLLEMSDVIATNKLGQDGYAVWQTTYFDFYGYNDLDELCRMELQPEEINRWRYIE